jgi:hypothetical protein
MTVTLLMDCDHYCKICRIKFMRIRTNLATTGLQFPQWRAWLGIFIFLDIGWMFFDRIAYHFHNIDITYSTILAGVGCAPEQYRIGLLELASIIHNHTPLSFQQVILASDFLCACATSVVLLLLLLRLAARDLIDQRRISLAAALLALLMVVNLHWTFYRVRPETLPGVLFVCLSIYLFDLLASARTLRSSTILVVSLTVLAIGQSFCRADLPVCLAAGEFFFALFFIPLELRSRRPAFLLAGLLTGICSVLIQLYLMKVRYPNSHYCGPVYTLKDNLASFSIFVSTVFLIPTFVGAVALLKHPRYLGSTGRALLIASPLHLIIFLCVGLATETRIFVPFAMALSPWIAVLGARLLSVDDTAFPVPEL